MGAENDIDVRLTATMDPSVARVFRQFLSDVSATSNSGARVIADWSRQARTIAVEVTNTGAAVTREQVRQYQQSTRERTRFEREFTSGVRREINDRTRAFNIADAERLRSLRVSQNEALREMDRSEKEMSRLHADALRENARLDAQYWKNRERSEKEGQRILAQMNADQAASGGGAAAGGGGFNWKSFLATGAMGLLRQFAPVMVGYTAYRDSKEFISSGVKLAEEIRDVDAAIKAYATSADQATRTLDYFTRAQDRSRQTSLQLKKIYVEIEPKGLTAGLSEATLRNVAVYISQIAQLRKETSPEALTKAFRNIIGGRIVGSNPLLAAIGMTVEQVKEMRKNGDDITGYVVKKMEEIATEAAKLGDSMDSVWTKTKFNIMASFSEGFLAARGSAVHGMAAIKETLNDPSFLNFIRKIGIVTAQVLDTIGYFMKTWINAVMVQFNIVKAVVSGVMTIISGPIEKMVSFGAFIASKFPTMAKLLTGMDANEWAEAKKQAKGFVDFWSESTINAVNSIKTRIENMSLDSVNFALSLAPMGDDTKGFRPPPASGDDDTSPNGETAADKKIAKAQVAVQKYIASVRERIEIIKAEQKVVTETEKNFKGTPLEAYFLYKKDLATDVKSVGDGFRSLSASIDVLGTKSSEVDELRSALAELRQELDGLAKIKYDTRLPAWLDELQKKWTKADLAGMARADKSTLNDARELHKGQTKMEHVYDKWQKEDTKDLHRIDLQTLKDKKEEARAYARELKQAQKDLKVWESGADSFVSALLTGGKGFAKAAAGEFNSMINEGSKIILHKMLELASGVSEADDGSGNFIDRAGKVIYGKDGNPVTSMDEAIVQGGNKSRMTNIQNGLQLAQIGFGSYSNAKQNPKGGITSGALGGFTAGLSSGNVGIAVVGAIVGAIAGAIGKASAQDEYKYAKFNFNNKGFVTSSDVQKIPTAELKQMVAQVQDAFDTIWNSLVKIMLNVKGVLPSLKEIDGKIQDNPSQNFLKHYDQFVHDTLPRQLIGMFQGGMQNAAVKLGMSAARFKEIWDHFSNLDPSKMISVLSDMFDALKGFQTVLQFLQGSTPLSVPDGSSPVPGAKHRAVAHPMTPSDTWQDYQEKNSNKVLYPTFASDTEDARNQMIELGKAVQSLTGESQVAAAKQLSGLMTDYMESSKQFMNDLIRLSHQIQTQVESMIQGLTAEGFKNADGSPDNEAQAKYWKGIADGILQQMSQAKNPDQINTYWQQYMQAIQNAGSAQSAMGPENAEAARKWMIQALTIGNQYFQAAIQRLGEDVNTMNDWVRTNLQPYINSFAEVLTKVGEGFNNIKDPIGELPPAIDPVINRMNDLTSSTSDLSSAFDALTTKFNSWNPGGGTTDGGGTTTGGDGGGGTTYTPDDPTPDPYPFIVYGITQAYGA